MADVESNAAMDVESSKASEGEGRSAADYSMLGTTLDMIFALTSRAKLKTETKREPASRPAAKRRSDDDDHEQRCR